MKRKLNKLILLMLMLAFNKDNLLAQETLLDIKVESLEFSERFYFYKGDKISVEMTITKGEGAFTYYFQYHNPNDYFYDRSTIDEQKKIISLKSDYSIEKTGAYSIFFKSKKINAPEINIVVKKNVTGEEGKDMPSYCLVVPKELYYPDLLTRMGIDQAIPATLETIKEYENIKLKEKGIDPEKLDQIIKEKNSHGNFLIDTTFEAHSTNKIGATIYADPFYTCMYFRACKGDTIVISIDCVKKIQGLEISNYNMKAVVGILKEYLNETNVRYFTFIAGDDFIYRVLFENDNITDVQCSLKVSRFSNRDKSCLKPITYTIEEKTIVANNGINQAKHSRRVPIKD